VTPEQQKEEISRAYVAAVAAHCGYAIVSYSQDQGAVDLSIGAASPVGAGHLADPRIDLQLKCTSDKRRVKQKHVSCQFETVAKHDVLVRPRSTLFLLVVMVLPPDQDDWIAHSADELIMRRCAFYKIMNNESKATVSAPTVKVPRDNHFSPKALAALMERVSKGELPSC
jgi:hypothetical protein